MPEQDTPMPTGKGHPRPHPSGEPGRQYDHLSVAGDGPGQTPIEDVVPGVLLVLVGIAMVLLVTLLPGRALLPLPSSFRWVWSSWRWLPGLFAVDPGAGHGAKPIST